MEVESTLLYDVKPTVNVGLLRQTNFHSPFIFQPNHNGHPTFQYNVILTSDQHLVPAGLLF